LYDYDEPDPFVVAYVLMSQAFYAWRRLETSRLAKAKIPLTREKVTILQLAKVYQIPLTPAEISRSLFRESQTIAGLLSRMEREGLVTRDGKRKGKPYTEVEATARGEELCSSGVEVLVSTIRNITSCLSPEELEQLLKLLRKIREKALDELRVELLMPPKCVTDWLQDVAS